MEKGDYKVLLFYKFVVLENPGKIRDEQRAFCESEGIKGRILIGKEGINGTLEGTIEATDAYKKWMHESEFFSDMPIKESKGTGEAFPKLKVKVRPEIVTLGSVELDVKNETAKEITAEEFDALYENDDDFVVLDLRNDFEVASGYFEKTIDPKLRHFRDLPAKLKEMEHLKDKKVVTVCTGGIRCEKATCLMKREGFNNIYQLKDGIHTYMDKFPGKRWKGTLFVFDNRMTTDVAEIVPEKEVVGTCAYCNISTENYYNDDSVAPSRKVLACDPCYEVRKEELRLPVSI
jgi:UPF0176 protein